MTTRRSEVPTGGEQAGYRPPAGSLVPGGLVGEGRYRLLAQCGAEPRAGVQFWRARDGQLRRDVALTLLTGSPADAAAVERARRVLERAAHTARLDHPGTARVLDVVAPGAGIGPQEGVLGLVIADWSAGTDLLDVIAEHPLPPGTAARLLEPLAAAVDQANHTGLVLGIDHPQRVRVTPDGQLRLAFPGPLAHAGMRDDVRGLGAVLYLLLTGRWPLPDGPEGVPPAPRGPDGTVLPPAALFPYIPLELSVAAVRCLAEDAHGGIRTGAALLQVLERARLADDQTQRLVALEEEYEDDGAVWTTRPPSNDKAQRRKLAIGVTALAVATVGVLAWVGMQLISFFDDGGPSGGPTITATAPGDTTAAGGAPTPKPVVPAGPIRPADIKVFNVGGTPDNPRRANRAVDGDPGTAWRTDTYKDQFPALKPGVGLMASFAEPVSLAEVAVDSPSDGTVVEIRSAPSADPELGDTKVIGRATLRAGQTKLQLDRAEPTQHVLVWITTLGQGNRSELSEIGFIRAQ
ncbi:protein kinase family protein [Actinokineospora sp. UTMC 2448]|uniref:protein kinase family protein n=1 Tax=Actinokineospora sp. UTMC 2448 TaxID=2268449 RepID=UPI0021648113|nr:protein kinase family protein [Actinokineospora sp. UTMC 2448]